MKNWTKHVILKDECPVTIYVNSANTQAYVFPLFGKCYGLSSSDGNVLDFTTNFLLGSESNVISFNGYINSMEETSVIHLEAV